MKCFLTQLPNANTDITIFGETPKHYEYSEITEEKAKELLYREIDPQGDYPIEDYKLIYSESLGRYGITYK